MALCLDAVTPHSASVHLDTDKVPCARCKHVNDCLHLEEHESWNSLTIAPPSINSLSVSLAEYHEPTLRSARSKDVDICNSLATNDGTSSPDSCHLRTKNEFLIHRSLTKYESVLKYLICVYVYINDIWHYDIWNIIRKDNINYVWHIDILTYDIWHMI